MQSGSGPLVSIAEGRMDVAEFSDLSEHEVGEILQVTILSSHDHCFEKHSWGLGCTKPERRDYYN